jgi:predicted O-linked N-acetylglucosamine transferase (SPINDLY family)
MITEAFNIALQHHQAGRLQEAEAIYRQILQIQPDHPDALHLLGVIAHQVGQHHIAVDYISRAIGLNPKTAEYYLNLGEAYRAQGKLEEAATSYRQAVMLKPAFVEAYNNLGNALKDQGKLEEAVASYRQAVAFKPTYAEAYNNLGNALKEQGKLEEAVAVYRQAVTIRPSYPEAHNNLGCALQAQGRLEEAVSSYQQAVRLKPVFTEAYNNLGLAQQEQGQLEEAVASYRQAVALKPAFADACNNLGNALKDQGKLEEAVTSYRQAVRLKPAFAEAYNNLGCALQDQGKLEEAVASYRQAVALKPVFAEAYNNLGCALQAQGRLEGVLDHFRQAVALKPAFAEAHNNLGLALRMRGMLEEAVVQLRQALALKPDYAEAHGNLAGALRDQGKLEEAAASYRRALALDPGNAAIHSNLLFDLTYHTADAAIVAQEHRNWNAQHARPLARQITAHHNDRDPDRRLRVGYVSADFWGHAISYFVEPLLAAHDHAQVEVFCYANGVRADATTQRMQAAADAWRSIVGLNDAAVAERIRADGIDLLVDLSSHTAGNRLLVFARKPAPVQVTYLGSLTTTALATMDYRLTDGSLSPADSPEWCSEELIRLPGCFVCYRPPAEAPPVAPLPALTTGQVTFGCFNTLAKVTPAVVALWSEILRGLPQARLILKSSTLADAAQRERYWALFRDNGTEAERIELLPKSSMYDYLATYGRIDIGLDPFPYNGCTTTCQALWMGVPVLTLAGAMSYSRFGVTLLSTLGLDGLIAPTPEAYVAKAVELANQRRELAALRAELRARMTASALCDAKAFARGVEQAYRLMWRRWCRSAA